MLLPMPWWLDDTVLNLWQTLLAAGSLVVAVLLGLGAMWLAKRQMDIAWRQMDRQAEQHAFFAEERANRPRVELRVTGMSQKNLNSPTGLTISAKNLGKRPADGYSWHLLIPSSRANVAQFTDIDWNPAQHGVVADNFQVVQHTVKGSGGKLFVNDHIEVAWLVVDGRQPFETLKVLWSVHGEDGRVPAEGYFRN
jgi:hypothetical protein